MARVKERSEKLSEEAGICITESQLIKQLQAKNVKFKALLESQANFMEHVEHRCPGLTEMAMQRRASIEQALKEQGTKVAAQTNIKKNG